MMFYWLFKVKCKHVMFFESLTSWDTVVNYNNYFRKECHNWLLSNNSKLGGFNDESVFVEVGKSYFFHRKYHCGQQRRGQRVAGMIERDTGRCWLEWVIKHDHQLLNALLLLIFCWELQFLLMPGEVITLVN